ncbi:uncharacterized protein [Parasteatoda tepidariorum]|uniref:uncharacterized protein isoform X1 n=1 Tax=Parasteatoda tepidariorum TaxID=114398 RepID=UPI001C72407A|nr:uncharacterized protein LOC122271516 [Parasteatoda tepidariorum]
MPYHCCAVNCKGNYANGPKVAVFNFPKDEAQQRRWLQALSRKDFIITKNSRVCEKHFSSDVIIKETVKTDPKTGEIKKIPLSRFKLKKDAIPTIFEGCPENMTKDLPLRESREDKLRNLEEKNFNLAIKESLQASEEYEKNHYFNNYEEFKRILRDNMDSSWSCQDFISKTCFFSFCFEPQPNIIKSVVVNENLSVECFFKNVKLSSIGNFSMPYTLTSINDLQQILDLFKNTNYIHSSKDIIDSVKILLTKLKPLLPADKNSVIEFLSEEISLLTVDKNVLRYSSNFLIFCSLVYSISPHCYKFIRNSNNLILPHPSTIERLCSSFSMNPKDEQFDENFLLYAKQKIQYLNEHQKIVSLMMDEIHLKQYYDYKAGNIVGKSVNNDKAANSAYVFMLQSFLSDFEDVAHILPVFNINADYLYTFLVKIILGLEKIGFHILCVTSDNNSLNGKAMSYFSTPSKLSFVYAHPADPERSLFFLFDPVHIFKCLRNNWLNQKNGHNMYFLDFSDFSKTKTASFKTLRNIHSLEEGQLIKFAYGISIKALNPTSMERQNVKLVSQIFNDHVISGLRALCEQTNDLSCSDTADYIQIISNWWKIMNVKNPNKGVHKKDKFSEPISNAGNDERIVFLKTFLNWLTAWKAANYSSGFLSKETFTALFHTTSAVIELSKYCFENLNFRYFLTGKIQTDALERRFGKFRQLSGGQYNISIRQVFETESKLRLQSVGPLKIKSSSFGEIDINLVETDNAENEVENEKLNFGKEIDVNEDDLIPLVCILPVLTYIAGFCCYCYLKRKKCSSCEKSITLTDIEEKFNVIDEVENSYIQTLDRGCLVYPKHEIVDIILHAYVVVQKLVSEEFESSFLQMHNHKVLAIDTTINVLERKEIFLNNNQCSAHDSSFIVKFLVTRAINTFLSNYCKKLNDSILTERLNKKKANLNLKVTQSKIEPETKKRKLQTLK